MGKLVINDLVALQRAAEKLGLEFRDGQTTYRWYGRYMMDSPLPDGYLESDLGRCTHALAVKGGHPMAYEVGVVARKDGSGYDLLADEWDGGGGLTDRIGPAASHLLQEYTACKVEAELRGKGFRLAEIRSTADGSLRMTLTRAEF